MLLIQIYRSWCLHQKLCLIFLFYISYIKLLLVSGSSQCILDMKNLLVIYFGFSFQYENIRQAGEQLGCSHRTGLRLSVWWWEGTSGKCTSHREQTKSIVTDASFFLKSSDFKYLFSCTSLSTPMSNFQVIASIFKINFQSCYFCFPPPSVIPYSRAVLLNILGQLSSFDWAQPRQLGFE